MLFSFEKLGRLFKNERLNMLRLTTHQLRAYTTALDRFRTPLNQNIGKRLCGDFQKFTCAHVDFDVVKSTHITNGNRLHSEQCGKCNVRENNVHINVSVSTR